MHDDCPRPSGPQRATVPLAHPLTIGEGIHYPPAAALAAGEPRLPTPGAERPCRLSMPSAAAAGGGRCRERCHSAARTSHRSRFSLQPQKQPGEVEGRAPPRPTPRRGGEAWVSTGAGTWAGPREGPPPQRPTPSWSGCAWKGVQSFSKRRA